MAAVLGANLTATAFVPVAGFGQVAIGTLIFGLTFTQRDLLHRRGRAFVYRVIVWTALANTLLMWSYTQGWGPWAVERFTALGWSWAATSAAYLAEGGWRVLGASLLAILLAESADTEVFHRLRQRWLGRSLVSNAVSIPVDTLVFNAVAFAGLFGAGLWWSIVFGEIVVKYAVSLGYALLLGWRGGSAEPR